MLIPDKPFKPLLPIEQIFTPWVSCISQDKIKAQPQDRSARVLVPMGKPVERGEAHSAVDTSAIRRAHMEAPLPR